VIQIITYIKYKIIIEMVTLTQLTQIFNF